MQIRCILGQDMQKAGLDWNFSGSSIGETQQGYTTMDFVNSPLMAEAEIGSHQGINTWVQTPQKSLRQSNVHSRYQRQHADKRELWYPLEHSIDLVCLH